LANTETARAAGPLSRPCGRKGACRRPGARTRRGFNADQHRSPGRFGASICPDAVGWCASPPDWSFALNRRDVVTLDSTAVVAGRAVSQVPPTDFLPLAQWLAFGCPRIRLRVSTLRKSDVLLARWWRAFGFGSRLRDRADFPAARRCRRARRPLSTSTWKEKLPRLQHTAIWPALVPVFASWPSTESMGTVIIRSPYVSRRHRAFRDRGCRQDQGCRLIAGGENRQFPKRERRQLGDRIRRKRHRQCLIGIGLASPKTVRDSRSCHGSTLPGRRRAQWAAPGGSQPQRSVPLRLCRSHNPPSAPLHSSAKKRTANVTRQAPKRHRVCRPRRPAIAPVMLGTCS